jgi:hypothetical protein
MITYNANSDKLPMKVFNAFNNMYCRFGLMVISNLRYNYAAG